MNDSEVVGLVNDLKPIDIRAQLFKNGNYDFIVKGVNEHGQEVEHFKQREALEILTANKYSKFLYGGGAGSAKAQPLDSKVYTPFGFKKMRDVKIGDVIKHPVSGNTNVIAIHPQGDKEIFEITFSDGAKARCCEDHLWKVWFASDMSKQEKNLGKGKIFTTRMLMSKLHRNPIIPLTAPIEFTLPINRFTTPLWEEIHPYVLGVLLGDGSLTKGLEYSTGDVEVTERIKRLIPEKFKVNKVSSKYAYSITQNERNSSGWGVNEIYDVIRRENLNCKSEFKFVPEKLKHAPLWVRQELIKGLMDSDGTASKNGNCSFSSSSIRLAEDFQYIVRSLGYKATIAIHKTTHLDSYRIHIQGDNCSNLFFLPRKKDRVRPFNGGFSESGRRIISIESVGIMEAQCITVDALDGLYVTDDFVVTHNSWTGAAWMLFMCINYPGIRCFIARNELKDIVESVYVTFQKVCKEYGFTDYKFNAVKNFIQFGNGSHINFIEIKYKPSDPEFQDLGSTEYTIGWIEEGGEVNEMGARVIGTRTGRHLNTQYGLKGIVFITCNPAQNWLKIDFYDKWVKGILQSKLQYLPALVTDNPFAPEDYIENLRELAKTSTSLYERLFKGDWNYVDSPNALVDRDALDGIFANDHVPEGMYFLTADVARYGSDKAVIGVWNGWILEEVLEFKISSTTEIEHAIRTFRMKYRIPKTRCIADSDGVGGGVVDGAGIKGFVNGARPIKEKGVRGLEMPEYRNLQIQCLYKLAEIINYSKIWIKAELSNEQKQHIVQELFQIQSKNTNNRKLDCKNKADIKQDIGRSPDYRDMIFMRVWFDLKAFKPRFMGSRPRATL